VEVDVYNEEGSVSGRASVPDLFSASFNKDIVLRALLAEQSLNYTPQGRDPLAGLRTSATYVGRYNTYRTLRHMGVAIRPRQKLAKGAMGEVRRIPSARKGRRAHPSKVEKRIVERINRKEYVKALEMAIAATASEEAKKQHLFTGNTPIVVSASAEHISKAKKVYGLLEKLGLKADLEKSHKPELRKGVRRLARQRHFRKSVVIIVSNEAAELAKAARNIPGVDVVSASRLSVSTLAPGGMPRLAVWTEPALNEAKAQIEKMKMKGEEK